MNEWILVYPIGGVIVGVIFWFVLARKSWGREYFLSFLVTCVVLIAANVVGGLAGQTDAWLNFALVWIGGVIGYFGTDPVLRVLFGTYARDRERKKLMEKDKAS